MPRIHVTLSGHEIRYDDPSPDLGDFLALARKMAEDPAVKERDLLALIYGAENPIMDKTLFPGRGAVTREVLENPVYHVLGDLLFRKEVQQRGLDVGAIAARYILTPGEVAERLGVHVSAVTKAIAGRRVSSWGPWLRWSSGSGGGRRQRRSIRLRLRLRSNTTWPRNLATLRFRARPSPSALATRRTPSYGSATPVPAARPSNRSRSGHRWSVSCPPGTGPRFFTAGRGSSGCSSWSRARKRPS